MRTWLVWLVAAFSVSCSFGHNLRKKQEAEHALAEERWKWWTEVRTIEVRGGSQYMVLLAEGSDGRTEELFGAADPKGGCRFETIFPPMRITVPCANGTRIRLIREGPLPVGLPVAVGLWMLNDGDKSVRVELYRNHTRDPVYVGKLAR